LLQILDHVPEKLVFAKSVFDIDVEFFYVCFNHPPWKLTYLYQKFNFIAISRYRREEAGGGTRCAGGGDHLWIGADQRVGGSNPSVGTTRLCSGILSNNSLRIGRM